MKRRPIWLRALLTLWGVWFATALAEPAGFLACPMHAGVLGAVSDEAAGASMRDGMATHAHHVATAAVESKSHTAQPSTTDAPSREHAHQCSCLGQCCAMAVDALGAHEQPLHVATRVIVPRATRPTMVTHFATLIEYSRPFANGPPTIIG